MVNIHQCIQRRSQEFVEGEKKGVWGWKFPVGPGTGPWWLGVKSPEAGDKYRCRLYRNTMKKYKT